MINERRNIERSTLEYTVMNKQIWNNVSEDIRNYNTEFVRTVDENSKNMNVLRCINSIGTTRIHHLKNEKGKNKTRKEIKSFI